MTLIACMHPGGRRILLADILLSSDAISGEDFDSPTRAYLSPERLRKMITRPGSLTRKIVEINSELVVLWSGPMDDAREFCVRIRQFTQKFEVTVDHIGRFLETECGDLSPELTAFCVPPHSNWTCILGQSTQGEALGFGEYIVAGTGTEAFIQQITRPTFSSDAANAVRTGLSVANDLLAQEVHLSGPLYATFGGGYEVLYSGTGGFLRADDIMHVFAYVVFDTSGKPWVSRYPHVLRQWYAGDNVFINSISATQALAYGMQSKTYFVPNILETRDYAWHRGEKLPSHPQFLCIHHLLANNQIPTSLIIQGKEVMDKFVSITESTESTTIEFLKSYEDELARHFQTTLAGRTEK